MWVLTSKINDYNQYGEYFECAFDSKPSIEELDKLGYDGKHLVENGGGRKNSEDV